MTVIWIIGSASDLKSYRVSNLLILAGWLGGLMYRYRMGGFPFMGLGICCIFLTILVAWPLFLLRVIGAGDIKLASVIGAFYGLVFLAKTMVLFVFLAGAYSLFRLLYGGMFRDRFHYLIQFVLYGRVSSYYIAERDGYDMVIALTPCMAIAYYLIRFPLW